MVGGGVWGFLGERGSEGCWGLWEGYHHHDPGGKTVRSSQVIAKGPKELLEDTHYRVEEQEGPKGRETSAGASLSSERISSWA